MKTHVDTAAAIRMIDTDQFVTRHGAVGPMSADTLFLEEDAESVTLETWFGEARRHRPDARLEVVRVSRVIDIVT